MNGKRKRIEESYGIRRPKTQQQNRREMEKNVWEPKEGEKVKVGP